MNMDRNAVITLENILDLTESQYPEDVATIRRWVATQFCKDCKNFIGDGGVCACSVPF